MEWTRIKAEHYHAGTWTTGYTITRTMRRGRRWVATRNDTNGPVGQGFRTLGEAQRAAERHAAH